MSSRRKTTRRGMRGAVSIDDLPAHPSGLTADDDPRSLVVSTTAPLPEPGRYKTREICPECGERLEVVVAYNKAKDLITRYECSIVKDGTGTITSAIKHLHFDTWKKLA